MPTKQLLKRPLDLGEILGWANAYRTATGKWPTKGTGGIAASKFETWARVDAALRGGLRGLAGGSSLAQLLAERLDARNVQNLPHLTVEDILKWADEHHQRSGNWPTQKSGPIPKSDGENWQAINQALQKGVRGLPSGSSLARLLANHRGVRNRKGLPPYTVDGILSWADTHHQQEGTWPHARTGSIIGVSGESWLAVDMALRHGRRGLPGGSSLALLLADNCGVRNIWTLPDLTIEQILAWADAFHKSTGTWPHLDSGTILESPGETWCAVNHALKRRTRGLSVGISLGELLALKRGVRNHTSTPKLTIKIILRWADAHHRRTGQWPTQKSGEIHGAPGETWDAVDAALYQGHRGLRRRSSLARLLAKYRNHRHCHEQPPLFKNEILRWADAHHERTGSWPNVNSGEIVDAPGERWDLIDNALRVGHRGQPGGSSLRKLLVRKRGVGKPVAATD